MKDETWSEAMERIESKIRIEEFKLLQAALDKNYLCAAIVVYVIRSNQKARAEKLKEVKGRMLAKTKQHIERVLGRELEDR